MKKKILILSSTINFIDIFLYDLVDKLSSSYDIHIITNLYDIKFEYNSSIKLYNYSIKRKPSFLHDILMIFLIIYKSKLIKPDILITLLITITFIHVAIKKHI